MGSLWAGGRGAYRCGVQQLTDRGPPKLEQPVSGRYVRRRLGSASSSGTALKTASIGGATVLTNAKGFTLYSFAPDTATKSNCNAGCVQYWPPVKGPATAGPGVTGTLTTITRSDGSMQAAYDGHPLYTYVGDTAPGQAKGNGLNLSGGVWHVVPASGGAAAAQSPSSGSGGGGY